MGETVLLIGTALISGLLATVVTLLWQEKAKKKENKEKIFSILMSKRYNIIDRESVDALNMIDVFFYSDKKVREAWRKFMEATRLPETQPNKGQTIDDKHLKLLETIAENIGYKEIKWDDIKDYYYPVGLSNKNFEEEQLRKAQLDLNLKQISNYNKKEESINLLSEKLSKF